MGFVFGLFQFAFGIVILPFKALSLIWQIVTGSIMAVILLAVYLGWYGATYHHMPEWIGPAYQYVVSMFPDLPNAVGNAAQQAQQQVTQQVLQQVGQSHPILGGITGQMGGNPQLQQLQQMQQVGPGIPMTTHVGPQNNFASQIGQWLQGNR